MNKVATAIAKRTQRSEYSSPSFYRFFILDSRFCKVSSRLSKESISSQLTDIALNNSKAACTQTSLGIFDPCRSLVVPLTQRVSPEISSLHLMEEFGLNPA